MLFKFTVLLISVWLSLFVHIVNCDSSASTTSLAFLDNVADYPSDAIRGVLLQVYPSLSPPTPPPSTTYGTKSGDAAEAGDKRVMTSPINGTNTSGTEKPISKVYGCVGIQNQFFDIDRPVCKTTIEQRQPRFGLAKDGKYQYIVNDPQLYQQKIFTQTCKYENKPCDIEADLSSGYKSVCIQSYTTVKMVVFVNGALTEDIFKLPVSCDCYLKSYFFY